MAVSEYEAASFFIWKIIGDAKTRIEKRMLTDFCDCPEPKELLKRLKSFFTPPTSKSKTFICRSRACQWPGYFSSAQSLEWPARACGASSFFKMESIFGKMMYSVRCSWLGFDSGPSNSVTRQIRAKAVGTLDFESCFRTLDFWSPFYETNVCVILHYSIILN